MDTAMNILAKIKNNSPLPIALLITLLIAIFAAPSIQTFDNHINDKTWQWLANDQEKEQRIIIVDIDEASIAKYGAWPWPRNKLATLSQHISELGATLQVFDMVFTTQKQGDEALIKQLTQHNTVLSQILAINADNNTQIGQLANGIETILCTDTYAHANAYIANTHSINLAANTHGHITPTIDSDGIIRRIPAFICKDQSSYPAIALSTLAAGIAKSAAYTHQTNQHWLQPAQQLVHPSIPEINIPLNKKGEILIPWWLAHNAITAISATDILENTTPPKMLNGAWVIIASTAFGSGDSVATPLKGITGGVEIHTQLISALLDNRMPYQPQGTALILGIQIITIALLMFFINQKQGRLSIYGAPLLSIALTLCILGLHVQLLKEQNLQIPSALAIIYTLLAGILISIKGYANNWEQSQRLYLNLSSYLPPKAAKAIAQQDPVSTLAAHHEHVFVMYIDLRNFSNWCNELPAEEIGAILHNFYKTVTEIVQKQGGQTEKYIGDAVLCVWRNKDDCILTAAEELINKIEHQLSSNINDDKLPALAVGIGIEYGTVLVASLGPAQRREYTVIGKAVTTAIQLQEMTTELALPILVGQGAAKQWNKVNCLTTQGEFMLTGANQPMELFTPLN